MLKCSLLLFVTVFHYSLNASTVNYTLNLIGGDDIVGTGHFLYDDNDGGSNAGFLSVEFNFSNIANLDETFSSLQLSASGVEFYGPGGNGAATLLNFFESDFGFSTFVFTHPLFTEASSNWVLLLVSHNNPTGFRSSFGRSDACTTSAIGNGGFGFCAGIPNNTLTNTSGRFDSLSNAVPVPASAWLFGSALAGLTLVRCKQN